MSAELPNLERLLTDAAERRYGRGRRLPQVRLPRTAVVAGLAAVAAVVVLAIVLLPTRSDERAAGPQPDPAAELARRYSAFSRERARTALETAIASDQRGVLDLREPVATQLLRRLPGGGVVAVVGTTPRGEKAVCVAVQERDVSGSSCGAAAELLSTERPWFVFGGIGRSSDEVVALVPDDVTSVRMQLEGGATRSLPVANNLAYAETGRPICRVTWTMADGRTGHQRGPTRAEEATPGDPKPRTCD